MRTPPLGATIFAMTDPSWLPILISSVALLVAITSLLWQVGKHLLDGPRLRITLEAAEWDPGFRLGWVRSKDGRYPSAADRQPGDAVECALLTVENVGRGAATFRNPAVSYRTARHGLLRRRGRYSATPRLFDIGDMDPHPSTSTGPHRLEPRSQLTFVVDIHSLIPGAKTAAHRRRAIVRPCVSVTGRRHPLRGKWRMRWRIPLDALTLRDYGTTIPIERLILLHMARAGGEGSSLGYRARLVGMHLWLSRESGLNVSQRVDAAIEESWSEEGAPSRRDDPMSHSVEAYYLGRWIEENSDAIDWSGAERQYVLRQAARASREVARPTESEEELRGGSAWYF